MPGSDTAATLSLARLRRGKGSAPVLYDFNFLRVLPRHHLGFLPRRHAKDRRRLDGRRVIRVVCPFLQVLYCPLPPPPLLSPPVRHPVLLDHPEQTYLPNCCLLRSVVYDYLYSSSSVITRPCLVLFYGNLYPQQRLQFHITTSFCVCPDLHNSRLVALFEIGY